MSANRAMPVASPGDVTNLGTSSSSGSVVKPLPTPLAPPQLIGRYALFGQIGAGGMGVVHLARLLGSAGFERAVAIKRVHPTLASDQQFIVMFREELRLLARVRHQNVISALDVVEEEDLLLVMEYVHGESLASLLQCARQAGEVVPVNIAVAIACGALKGLHAAHEATDAAGAPLGIIHRDVSPHNVLVGCDGVARVVDFGVAKSVLSRQMTRIGELRGKPGYLAPEQLLGEKLTRAADLYAMSVALWETLAGQRLNAGRNLAQTVEDVLAGRVPTFASVAKQPIPAGLEAVVRRGLSTNPAARFATAREMALALEAEVEAVSAEAVGEWVANTAQALLAERARQLSWVETCPIGDSEQTLIFARLERGSATPLELNMPQPPAQSREMTRAFPIQSLVARVAPSLPPPPVAPLAEARAAGTPKRHWLVATAAAVTLLLGMSVVSRAGWFDSTPAVMLTASPPPRLEPPSMPARVTPPAEPQAPTSHVSSPAVAVSALQLGAPAPHSAAMLKPKASAPVGLPASVLSNPYSRKPAALPAPAAKRASAASPKTLSQDGF